MDAVAAIAPRLFAWQLVVLYAFAGSVAVIHLRGRVRFKFARQLTDHSTFVAPFNVLIYLFSAVPNKPYVPVSSVPDPGRPQDQLGGDPRRGHGASGSGAHQGRRRL